MKDKRTSWSIVSRIDQSTRRLTVLLVVPALFSLAMMLYFSGKYYSSIERMNTIANLKPKIEEAIPETVWNLVSGRESLSETQVAQQIEEVEATMQRVSEQAGEKDSLQLVVAQRAMGTLSGYVSLVCSNIDNGVPVIQSEAVLEEIRDVASLVNSMLNDYMLGEIEAAAQMSRTLQDVVAVGACVEIALLLFSLLWVKRFRKRIATFIREPIEKLEKVTKQLAEGELEARLPMTQVDELWALTGQVNQMADKLEEMMRQRVENERELKKAELRTLQAQINPHFLYNTLDAIVWKAEAGDEEEVIHLTRALSDFFRISLSSGADWISIKQEKKHIAGYLSIQKIRYSDILSYEIDLPEEMEEYYILKLLLQPLVENALYHGIKYKRGGGMIRVTGEKQGDSLIFKVSDTGRGMDAETLEKLRQRMENREPTHESGTNGFGLVNVNLRIRLYYNQAEGLKIESRPEGTVVSFRVPCKKEAIG